MKVNCIHVYILISVVRVSLFIQNLCVMGSALVVCTILRKEAEVAAIWDGKLSYVLKALVMVLAILARLASVAYKIAVEKDWIVIIAAGNSSQLASEFFFIFARLVRHS